MYVPRRQNMSHCWYISEKGRKKGTILPSFKATVAVRLKLGVVLEK